MSRRWRGIASDFQPGLSSIQPSSELHGAQKPPRIPNTDIRADSIGPEPNPTQRLNQAPK
jgi:hypothetical protein